MGRYAGGDSIELRAFTWANHRLPDFVPFGFMPPTLSFCGRESSSVSVPTGARGGNSAVPFSVFASTIISNVILRCMIRGQGSSAHLGPSRGTVTRLDSTAPLPSSRSRYPRTFACAYAAEAHCSTTCRSYRLLGISRSSLFRLRFLSLA